MKLVFLTKKRRELLSALLKSDSIADAARSLGIAEVTARQRLFLLRRAYKTVRKELEEYERYRLRMPSRYL